VFCLGALLCLLVVLRVVLPVLSAEPSAFGAGPADSGTAAKKVA
jgi:hypothetical protein